MSWPAFPVRLSAPAPPVIVSARLPPISVSAPEPPVRDSLETAAVPTTCRLLKGDVMPAPDTAPCVFAPVVETVADAVGLSVTVAWPEPETVTAPWVAAYLVDVVDPII